MTAPIAVGDLVRFRTSLTLWRVTAVSAAGDLADLEEWDHPGRWSPERRRRVDTRRLVKLGRRS